MSTLTTNYGMVKPALADSPPDITVMNPNWDRIDDELKNHSSQLAAMVNKDGSVPMDDLTVGIRSGTTGINSLAQGVNVISSGTNSHAEGDNTKAYSHSSHAEGSATQAGGSSTDPAIGVSAHAENIGCVAVTDGAHAEGLYSMAVNGTLYTITAFNNTTKTITLDSVVGLSVGNTLWIRIVSNKAVSVVISAINGLVATLTTTETITANWTNAVLANTSTIRSVHAEGSGCLAVGYHSHAEGAGTVANSDGTHAEGLITKALGFCSHAEGENCIASGSDSHVEGYGCTADGMRSHAGGYYCGAYGSNSFCHGNSLLNSGSDMAVFGRFNANSATDLFQIGNGTSDVARSNAFIVDNDGATTSPLITEVIACAYLNASMTASRVGSTKQVKVHAVNTQILNSGNWYTLCTLPVKYRPTVNLLKLIVFANGSTGYLEITTTGIVNVSPNASIPTSTILSLTETLI